MKGKIMVERACVRSLPIVLALVVLLARGGTAGAATDTRWMIGHEVSMTKDDFQRLDPFEAQRLDAADQAFAGKRWREAKAAYDAFMLEFPKSHVIAYALVRKGRAIQKDNKMAEAIETYTEVMDYFPNAVDYAAPALYYMGECRASQQKRKAALELWKEMAEDVDYRKHELAAPALNRLADGLYAQGNYAAAGKFYLQSATDFRRGHKWNIEHSIERILHIWVRNKPDVKALRAACKALSGFERNPKGALAENDPHFWGVVTGTIRKHGRFNAEQKSERVAYYTYWTKAMEGQMPQDDGFQKALADFHLALDGKQSKWYARLDKQFKAYQKDGDNDRIAKWMIFYKEHPKKLEEYFRKFDAAATSNETLVPLTVALFQVDAARPTAQLVFQKLKFKQMPDHGPGNQLSKGSKGGLASTLYNLQKSGSNAGLTAEAEPFVLGLYKQYNDRELAYWDELGYWHFRASRYGHPVAAEKALPMADKCTQVPKYAQKAYWMKGQMLQQLGRINEAIAAFRATDDMPKNLFTIAECLVGQGKHAAAVSELSQIEGSGAFPREAPKAAWRIATVWQAAGNQKLYVGALTTLIAKYPRSRESSDAHNALENMGLSHLIRGGKGAE
ncbi:MAG: hypothetical protein QGH42_00655 [Kiritimatiellia bacterium]|nr:hypothetical protein [Kiritimatiellia bacterium]MDP6810264.1 hypothetical protein [Kiritimatiellia bacterium]MDP7022747.1 hypothetical protein [Kiritimatiellia bacterium]